MKNKWLLLSWGLLLLIWVLVYFLFLKNTKNYINIYQWITKSWDVSVIDTNKIIQNQQKLDLPPEYTKCKKDLKMIDCILQTDSNQKTDNVGLLDSKNLANKMDQLQMLEKQLGPNQKQMMAEISFDIQDVYATRKPSIIFENMGCKTFFCEKIIGDAKIQIVQRMFNRWLIKKDSTCNKIPENLPKEYCLSLFKK